MCPSATVASMPQRDSQMRQNVETTASAPADFGLAASGMCGAHGREHGKQTRRRVLVHLRGWVIPVVAPTISHAWVEHRVVYFHWLAGEATGQRVLVVARTCAFHVLVALRGHGVD